MLASEAEAGCGRPSSECLWLGKVSSDTSPTTMPCFTLAAAKGRPSAPAYPYTPVGHVILRNEKKMPNR